MTRRWRARALAAVFAVACPGALLPLAPAAASDGTLTVRLAAPTDRYNHAVLGDGIEYGALELIDTADPSRVLARLTLPQDRVFEDVVPLDAGRFLPAADGELRVVVVESGRAVGARLAVYGLRAGAVRRIAATPPIGRAYRWLAPAGVGDFDGDGRDEIAYVETPHLGKVLKLVRLERDGDGHRLVPVAEIAGFTNHRIGDAHIVGGLRRCGGRDEVVVSDAGWSMVAAVSLHGGAWSVRPLSRDTSRRGIEAAMACGLSD